MFYVGCLISPTHVCFIVFLSLYVSTDVLIYSAAQLQECLMNLLTYLLTVFTYHQFFSFCSDRQTDKQTGGKQYQTRNNKAQVENG